jgi:hypothetical protein
MRVIELCTGLWSLSPLYALKKTKLRFCVNFRDLNKKIIEDVYPLPRIDGMLDVFSRVKLFLILDITSGYKYLLWKKLDTKQDLQLEKTYFNSYLCHLDSRMH